MRILLDTCVVSEIQKPDGNQRVKDAVQRYASDHVFLSVMTTFGQEAMHYGMAVG